MNELLVPARENGTAIAAFECWNSANIRAICEGAAEAGSPVILQASPVEIALMGGPEITRGLVELYVRQAGITAALHLDHGTTLEQVRECASAGFTSVMLDGSRLPFADNVKISKEAATIARQYGISIEAELGRIGGAEAGLEVENNHERFMTDPDEAETFVGETGIDCLAVGIGTVHGDYRGEPKIDLDRLEAIAGRVSVPLVLHGGSGTPPPLLRGAIRRGIAKINICTELHKAQLGAIAKAREELTPSVPGLFYVSAHQQMKETVVRHIQLFSETEEAVAAGITEAALAG